MRADLAAFQAYRNDETVGRYQGWSAQPDPQAPAFIEEMGNAVLFPRGKWVQLAVADRDTNRLIGDVGACLASDGRTAELGFSISPRSQRQGLGTEAVHEAIALLFEHTPGSFASPTDATSRPSASSSGPGCEEQPPLHPFFVESLAMSTPMRPTATMAADPALNPDPPAGVFHFASRCGGGPVARGLLALHSPDLRHRCSSRMPPFGFSARPRFVACRRHTPRINSGVGREHSVGGMTTQTAHDGNEIRNPAVQFGARPCAGPHGPVQAFS